MKNEQAQEVIVVALPVVWCWSTLIMTLTGRSGSKQCKLAPHCPEGTEVNNLWHNTLRVRRHRDSNWARGHWAPTRTHHDSLRQRHGSMRWVAATAMRWRRAYLHLLKRTTHRGIVNASCCCLDTVDVWTTVLRSGGRLVDAIACGAHATSLSTSPHIRIYW